MGGIRVKPRNTSQYEARAVFSLDKRLGGMVHLLQVQK